MMDVFSAREDGVSNIHRRWFFTRLTPGSIKASYAMTLFCAFLVVVISHVHLGTTLQDLTVHLPLGLAAIFALGLLDKGLLRGAPIARLSKIVHVSSFANLLWAITVIFGILADSIFAKSSVDYIVAGMMLAAGLRVGIFTSVFGVRFYKAALVCMVMPLLFFLAFVPPQDWDILLEPVGMLFGSLFLVLAIIWAAVADRAGRPHVQSTFQLLQAFISSWTENRSGSIEGIFEARAHEEIVSTGALRFTPPSGTITIVLPDVHPGPFGHVGGSNLPYVLFKRFDEQAIVLHGISGHSLNIPSKRELDRYIASLNDLVSRESGKTASEPIQTRCGNATATAVAFGNTALVMLSLAPKGMEDIPQEVRAVLESHATSLGISLLLADCHNAMGSQIDDNDKSDLIDAAKECLDLLRKVPQYEFRVGFASLANIPHKLAGSSELGQPGLAVIVLEIADTTYAIGWADANNMENNLRGKILSATTGVKMLEVCTSDTHATSGKRTTEGYFALGTASDQDAITKAFTEMSAFASAHLESCRFEVAFASSKLKVMGEKQFEDYSSALDRSMNITKYFVGATFIVFVAMLILAS